MADLQVHFFLRSAAEQVGDGPDHHAQDAEDHEPKAKGVDALDDPTMRQADRALRLLADRIGALDVVQAEIGNQRHVGERQQEAADKLEPRPASEHQVLRKGIDAGMCVDRVAVAHPQREDRGMEVPLQLLQLGVGQVQADLAGDDLILCQITTQSRHDPYSVSLVSGDLESGRLNVDSFIRPNRLFTVDHAVIIYSVAKIKASKLDEARAKIRQLFG